MDVPLREMVTVPLLSATQLSLWGECQRKWSFKYQDKIRPAPGAGALLGTEVQDTQIDPYLATGRPFDFSRPSGEIANALVPLLPKPMTSGMELRHKFVMPSPTGLWAYEGELDIFAPDSAIVPGLAGGVPLAADIKTTSNFDYVKTPETLATDIQAQIYAMHVLYETGVDSVDLAWLYVRTRKPHRTQRSALRAHADAVAEQFDRIETISRTIVTTRSGKPKTEELRPNARMCDAYGGCPYRHMCNLSPAVQSAEMNTIVDPKTNAFLNTLRKTSTPAPIAGLPAPAPAPPLPPAAVITAPGTGTLSPFQAQVAQLAAEQGTITGSFVPTGKPTAAINPPESALPPAPPVGAVAAAASGEAPAPEPKRRGRKPGSKNAVPEESDAEGVALEELESVVSLMQALGVKRLAFEGTRVRELELK